MSSEPVEADFGPLRHLIAQMIEVPESRVMGVIACVVLDDNSVGMLQNASSLDIAFEDVIIAFKAVYAKRGLPLPAIG